MKGAQVSFAQEPNQHFVCIDITEEEALKRIRNATVQQCYIDEVRDSPISKLLITKEWIALGMKSNHILVLDFDGKPIYALRFSTSGGFNLFYDDELNGLVLYIPRNSSYFTFDMTGGVVRVEGYSSKKKSYEGSEARRYDPDGSTYFLSCNKGVLNRLFRQYTLVTKKDIQGTQTIFYDNGRAKFFENNYYKIAIICIFLFNIPLMIIKIKNGVKDPSSVYKRKGKESDKKV